MQCLILDPRQHHREHLARRLARHADVECVGSFAAPGMADAWHGHTPDVVFLGSETPGLDALLTVGTGSDRTPPVFVLVGDLPIHALTAFELQVTDFLLRPIDTIRLEECLRRVREALQRQHALARIESLNSAMSGRENAAALASDGRFYRDFWIRSRSETVRVPQASIIWIKAARGYAYFHLPQRQLLHRISMVELEERLDPNHFLRIHRSAIVNVHCIERTYTNRHGTWALGLTGGDQVRIGRKYRLPLAEYMYGKQIPNLEAA